MMAYEKVGVIKTQPPVDICLNSSEVIFQFNV